MQGIINIFKSSFARGPIWGPVDFAFKIMAVLVWGFVFSAIVYLLYNAFMFEYNPKAVVWWVSYCFIAFITSTLPAYTAIFVRREIK